MGGMTGDTATTADGAVHVPGPLLRPFVARMSGYRFAGFEAGVHAGLPSRHLTFVVAFDEPLLVGSPDAPGRYERFDACVGGFHTRPVAIPHDGSQHGIHIDVTPAGARALFGMPAGELAAETVELSCLWGGVAAELHERLALLPTWPQRFAAAERVLCRVAAERAAAGVVVDDLQHAWGRLLGAGGRIEVAALAAETGWSRRHFTQRFTGEFGFGPKAMAKVLRFERSKAMLTQAHRPRLVDIAAACGYADQAHMARDWNELAGASPTGWMTAERLPIVQDPDGPDGAS